MTNEGLRVTLSLRAPRTEGERRDRKFVAILDCFSRPELSRRIGILLQQATGGVIIRTGRSLLLNDMYPDASYAGYQYISKTIQIAVANDVARHQLSRSYHVPILVDFSPHYRYNVEYVHLYYEVEKDPHTVGSCSLRIKLRRLEELIQSDAESRGADGFVEHCNAY